MEIDVRPLQRLKAMELTPESRSILENEWKVNLDSTISDGTVFVREPVSKMIVAQLSSESFLSTYEVLPAQ